MWLSENLGDFRHDSLDTDTNPQRDTPRPPRQHVLLTSLNMFFRVSLTREQRKRRLLTLNFRNRGGGVLGKVSRQMSGGRGTSGGGGPLCGRHVPWCRCPNSGPFPGTGAARTDLQNFCKFNKWLTAGGLPVRLPGACESLNWGRCV